MGSASLTCTIARLLVDSALGAGLVHREQGCVRLEGLVQMRQLPSEIVK